MPESETAMTASAAALTEINRTMWSYGDYARVARLLQPGAARMVERLGSLVLQQRSVIPEATSVMRFTGCGLAAASPA